MCVCVCVCVCVGGGGGGGGGVCSGGKRLTAACKALRSRTKPTAAME